MAKTPEGAESVSARLDAIEARLEQILAAISGSTSAGSTTTIELTEAEIDGISTALDKMGAGLSDRQQLYLLGIFGAAAHHLEGVASSEGAVPESLRTIKVANAANIRQIRLGDTLAGLTKIEQGKLGSIGTPGGEVQDSVGVGVGVACVGVDWSKDLAAVDAGAWRTNPAFDMGGMSRLGNPVAGLPGGFGR